MPADSNPAAAPTTPTPSPAVQPVTPGTQQPGTQLPAQGPAPTTPSQLVGLGVFLLVIVFFVWAFLRKRAQTRADIAKEPEGREIEQEEKEAEARELQAPVPLPRLEAPPREETEISRAAAKAAADHREAAERAEAARLEAKRLIEAARGEKDTEATRRADAARDAAAKLREEAEARRVAAEEAEARAREEEEERKKQDYKLRRQQEADEKERRRREAEEAKQRAEEEARRKAAEEAEAKRKAEEEQQRKVAAEAGKTLAEGLAKTRGGFVASLNSFLGREKVVDEAVLAQLEEVLFGADIGVQTATRLLEFARDKVKKKDLANAEKLKDAIRDEVERIVAVDDKAPPLSAHKPYVIMVVGVNGSGKTTTIGKLAAKLANEGKKVVLGAGDTFRAAAAEQLEVWAARANVPVVKAKEGSDPASVLFDAIKKGQTDGADVVICDTAGRLHTKANLMEELKRVRRVMDKALPGAPHDVLLVLDSTNGQNAILQAREFNAAMAVNAIVLTKLDGTAKGGVIIGICDELKIPVRYVGVGEALGDLKKFDPREYVHALFD